MTLKTHVLLSLLSLLLSYECCHTHVDAAPSRVDEFELRMHHTQTRTQRRALLGPARASDEARAQALEETERVVDRGNAEHRAGTRSYFLGYNDLSDLSDAEYRAFLRSKPDADSPKADKSKRHPKREKRTKRQKATTSTTSGAAVTAAVPTSVNWVTAQSGKYMTPIKNQGTCGSCWAFAGVSVIESRIAIAQDVQASPLSVEQVLSCSAPLDHIRSKFSSNMTSSSAGCEGGMPFLTYEYLRRASPHGLTCDEAYPYIMATSEGETVCAPLTSDDVAVRWQLNTTQYEVVMSSDEDALLAAVAQGPVTANIDSSGDGFRHYGGGLYDAQDCGSDGDEVNHAVVIVGFGETQAGEPFWLLRNTWGTMWGEDGYMRIARGDSVGVHGPCNLYVYASYPVGLQLATDGSNSTANSSEPTCAVLTPTYDSLSFSQLLGLSGSQVAMVLATAVLCLLSGALLAHGWEMLQNRKEAAGEGSYKHSYARWVLPSREQITEALAQRRDGRSQRPQTPS